MHGMENANKTYLLTEYSVRPFI